MLLSNEHYRTTTLKKYSNIQVSQLKKHDTLIGFLPDSSIDVLIICQDFERHPVVSQIKKLLENCVFICVGNCHLASASHVSSVLEAFDNISKFCDMPAEKQLPFSVTLSFLRTLTNPLRATKLDEGILGLFPEYHFFACIVETAKQRTNLLPYIYHQIIDIDKNCLAYRFSEERAIVVLYTKHNAQELQNHIHTYFLHTDRSAFRVYTGTVQEGLVGIYTSFFEAYETLYVDGLFTPCSNFEDISDQHYEKPDDIIMLEHEIISSMQYRQGRDAIPLVLKWFDICRATTASFTNIQCEAILLYGDIKRVIFDHYVLKPRRIKRGLEVFEIINIPTFEELKTWFIVWLDYTLTDFAKARNKAPRFTSANAYQFIENHICEDCSLTNLAEYFNLTSQYVSTLFKQQCGCTFQNYVTKQKMKKAGELLLQSDKSIHETAKQLGFSDQKYFRTIFKAYWKVTPKMYTKQNQPY